MTHQSGKPTSRSFLGWAVKHHKAGRVGSRHDDIGPSVPIQIGSRHAIDGSLAVAEWHRLIPPSRAIVEIDYARSLNIADNDLRRAVVIKIRGDHGVGNRRRLVELNAFAEVGFAVVEVDKAAQILVAGGGLGMKHVVTVRGRRGTSR